MPLTMAELRLKHAQLTERAQRLRQQSRALSALSRQAGALAREVRQTQQHADDYAVILNMIQREESR
jgi:hypothetical protein